MANVLVEEICNENGAINVNRTFNGNPQGAMHTTMSTNLQSALSTLIHGTKTQQHDEAIGFVTGHINTMGSDLEATAGKVLQVNKDFGEFKTQTLNAVNSLTSSVAVLADTTAKKIVAIETDFTSYKQGIATRFEKVEERTKALETYNQTWQPAETVSFIGGVLSIVQTGLALGGAMALASANGQRKTLGNGSNS